MDKEEIKNKFARGLCEFTSRTGYTHEELSKIIGCSQANISHLKSGKTVPHLNIIYNLLEHGMTLEEAFGPELAKKLVSQSQPSKPPVPESPLEKARFVRAGLKELLAQLTELDARLPDVPEDR